MLDTNTSSIWEIKNPILLHAQRRRAEVTRSLLQPQNNDSVLDVGCGDGHQISHFANLTSQVVGIDISKPKLKKAKRNIAKAEFICATSSKPPFKPKIFDKVLCLELLEHLKYPSKTLDEIDSVLKERGILIISVPYKEQIILTQCIHCGKPTPNWGHLHSFDEQKISSILPQNYSLIKREHICTAASSYHLFAFLPTKLWKVVDSFSTLLPSVNHYWMISKFQKVRTEHRIERIA